jgi:ATP-dependent Clp protease ATP-binding subunit ClpA
MDVANFTEKSKEAISTASNIATRNSNPEIKDCHMVAAFLEDKSGVITMLCKKMDINVESLNNQIQEEINKLDGVEFVWITDGIGWNDAKDNLHEAYQNIPNLITLDNIVDELSRILK